MKHTILALLLLAVLPLLANPEYYPVTTLAESFLIEGNAPSQAAMLALDEVLVQTNPGEFISARFYHASGALSSTSVEARFAQYGVATVPTVVFNGDTSLIGPGTAQNYLNEVNERRFASSPVKLSIGSFNPATGAVSATLTKMDPEFDLAGHQLVWLLAENNVGTATSVTRQVLFQELNFPGGNQATFDITFTPDPSWNAGNLWAAVCVQQESATVPGPIIQAASTLPVPNVNLRYAADWDNGSLVVPPGGSYNSEPFWFFNLGIAENYEIKIVVDSEPGDWYFNYCDEDGNCYPGSMPLPLNLGAGESKTFHLNLWVGTSGYATFHYEVTSPTLGTFIIPYVCRTSDVVSAQDPALTPAPLSLAPNHPNPFRGATTFSVTADQPKSGVSVQIFNSRGQKVAETPLQNLKQGENRIDWQPRDLPSGVYFYRLNGDSSSLRKLLYLK